MVTLWPWCAQRSRAAAGGVDRLAEQLEVEEAEPRAQPVAVGGGAPDVQAARAQVLQLLGEQVVGVGPGPRRATTALLCRLISWPSDWISRHFSTMSSLRPVSRGPWTARSTRRCAARSTSRGCRAGLPPGQPHGVVDVLVDVVADDAGLVGTVVAAPSVASSQVRSGSAGRGQIEPRVLVAELPALALPAAPGGAPASPALIRNPPVGDLRVAEVSCRRSRRSPACGGPRCSPRRPAADAGGEEVAPQVVGVNVPRAARWPWTRRTGPSPARGAGRSVVECVQRVRGCLRPGPRGAPGGSGPGASWRTVRNARR